MRKLICTIGFSLAVMATPAMADHHEEMDGEEMAEAPASLYDRLGGQEAVEAVVADFAGRVLADERINKKFAKSDADRLVHNLTDFVCMATGGPCEYDGLSMKKSHAGMGVTSGEFGALVEDLVATLDKFNVPEAEKNELLAALGPLGPEIVEVDSDATGTALPDAFEPLPALPDCDCDDDDDGEDEMEDDGEM